MGNTLHVTDPRISKELTMLRDRMTLAELRHHNLDHHVYEYNEDWNEPLDWEAGESLVYATGAGDEVIFVLTPTRGRDRDDRPKTLEEWTPWTDTILLAIYQFENPKPLAIWCFDRTGKMGYNTITGGGEDEANPTRS